MTAAAPAAPSPILSASALVRPLESRSPIAATPAGSGAGATALVPPPPVIPLPKAPPWWRRRRMFVLLAILIVLTAVSVSRLGERAAGLASPSGTPDPTRTPRNTAPVVATSTPALTTAAATATLALTATPTAARTPTPPTPTPVVPPTATPVPTDDHGNTPQTATAITPGVYTGTIEVGADMDYFRFNANAGTMIAIEFKGSSLNGGAVALLVSTGVASGVTQVAEDTDSGSGAKINHQATQAAIYFIRVRSTRSDTGTYSFLLAAR
jgi:hypothetical protein